MSNTNKLLLVLTIIAVIVLGVYAYRVLPSYFRHTTVAEFSNTATTPTVLPSDQKRGATNSTKTIIEFGDMECPYCGLIDPKIQNLLLNHPDVRFVWKDCPLPNHPNAQFAAEAAQCAGDQGKYWEYRDILLQNNDRLSGELYSEAAMALGLETEKFTTCLTKGYKRERVKESLKECAAAGVTELPWFHMNGKNYSGTDIIYELNTDLNK